MKTTFFGHEVSEYGIEHNRVDYATLGKCFDCVMNNSIYQETSRAGLGYWELENGAEILYQDKETGDYVEYDDIEDWDNIYENYVDIYQWFIISDRGAYLLKEFTDEIVYYNDELDMYLWGITHFGTPWQCVLTDIKIDDDLD